MAQATFISGDSVKMVDYTPSGGDVAEGDVVLIGEVAANTSTGAVACVAHRPIANNTLGAVAILGGVYDMVNLNNAATGAFVYWDGTSKVTTVSNTKAPFGVIVANGGGGANSTCRVFHNPFN